MAQQEWKEKVRGEGNAWSHCARWKALNYSGGPCCASGWGVLVEGLGAGERDLATEGGLGKRKGYVPGQTHSEIRCGVLCFRAPLGG